MKAEDFATLIERFFADHLEAQRNLSPNTLAAYRDTFKLLLIFLATYHRTSIDQLTLDSLRSEAVLAFLEDLERSRGNAPRTRNVRLAAIRTFARFAISRSPASGFLRTAQRILAIPLKKSSTRLLGFLDQQQIRALLSSTDESTWSGRRDRLLFLLLYNTGARIAKALQSKSRICENVQSSSTAKAAKKGSSHYGHRPTGCFITGAAQIRSQLNSPYLQTDGEIVFPVTA